MITAGFNSQRSVSGVSIHKLSEITGYSLQICRKYLRGEAIPEPTKLLEISQKLNVSAGWLLFGNGQDALNPSPDKIIIRKNNLHYIFLKVGDLYNDRLLEQEVANFLMELVNDVSLINATDEQSKKIIDLALSSVKHFNKSNWVS
ncbi:MAG: helix-turn-helix transcriptional regulator [Legionella sp.]|nr:helix-turn-helix transcriptional regulator [Legionella sp.]